MCSLFVFFICSKFIFINSKNSLSHYFVRIGVFLIYARTGDIMTKYDISFLFHDFYYISHWLQTVYMYEEVYV